VYALGAVLHHLLTGVQPKADQPPPPVRVLRPEAPPAVEAVVARALAVRPQDRYPSAAAFADALDAAAVRTSSEEAGERLLVEPVAVSRADDTLVLAAPPRRRRLLVLAIVALVVLAGAGTAAWLVRQRMDVAVSTADGALRLSVPRDWGAQVRRSAWDLGPYGASGRIGTALAASPDVTRWSDPASDVPGVFAGRVDGAPPPGLLGRSAAASCPVTSNRVVSTSGVSGPVTRRLCPGSPTAYVEAVLQPPSRAYTVYVQVKEPAGADTADDVIDSLAVNPS
jgi:hypothetical protein